MAQEHQGNECEILEFQPEKREEERIKRMKRIHSAESKRDEIGDQQQVQTKPTSALIGNLAVVENVENDNDRLHSFVIDIRELRHNLLSLVGNLYGLRISTDEDWQIVKGTKMSDRLYSFAHLSHAAKVLDTKAGFISDSSVSASRHPWCLVPIRPLQDSLRGAPRILESVSLWAAAANLTRKRAYSVAKKSETIAERMRAVQQDCSNIQGNPALNTEAEILSTHLHNDVFILLPPYQDGIFATLLATESPNHDVLPEEYKSSIVDDLQLFLRFCKLQCRRRMVEMIPTLRGKSLKSLANLSPFAGLSESSMIYESLSEKFEGVQTSFEHLSSADDSLSPCSHLLINLSAIIYTGRQQSSRGSQEEKRDRYDSPYSRCTRCSQAIPSAPRSSRCTPTKESQFYVILSADLHLPMPTSARVTKKLERVTAQMQRRRRQQQRAQTSRPGAGQAVRISWLLSPQGSNVESSRRGSFGSQDEDFNENEHVAISSRGSSEEAFGGRVNETDQKYHAQESVIIPWNSIRQSLAVYLLARGHNQRDIDNVVDEMTADCLSLSANFSPHRYLCHQCSRDYIMQAAGDMPHKADATRHGDIDISVAPSKSENENALGCEKEDGSRTDGTLKRRAGLLVLLNLEAINTGSAKNLQQPATWTISLCHGRSIVRRQKDNTA